MENKRTRVDEKSMHRNSYGWTRTKNNWIKKLLTNLKKCWNDYCENSTIVGYKYLSESSRPWIERILWIVIHATTMCALGFMIIGLWQQYVCTPVVTVVDSDNYPSRKLDFPGIAICSINRISKKAAENLARKIKMSNLVDKSFDDILKLVSKLGGLYDTAFERNEDDVISKRKQVEATHDMFLKYLGEDYDITEIMQSNQSGASAMFLHSTCATLFLRQRHFAGPPPMLISQLTPKCTDILLACTYKNILANCSDLLKFRKTQNGFCCTFNYAREADDISSTDDFKKYAKIESEEIGSPGIANGLTVVLEPFVEDYLLPFLPTTGWMITIFNPGDYPDNTSGGVSEALVSPSSESFLELSVSSFYSENEIRPVSVLRRKCMFTDETSAMQTGYTYSDCIVDCRAKAIWDSCYCRPFFLPRRGNDQYSRKVCNTEDESCLHKHKSSWWSVLPHTPDNEESSSYKKAIGDGNKSLKCGDCYPACTDIRYYLQMRAIGLRPGDYNTSLLQNIKLDDQSIVHIYFKKYGSVRLKQDVGYYWYELLSDIGGTCGVFIGFSLLSIIELMYFIGQRTYGAFSNYIASKLFNTNDSLDNNPRIVRGLYWNELIGQSRIYTDNRKMRSRDIQRY